MPQIRLIKNRKHVQIEFPDSLPHPTGRRGGRATSLHLQRGTVRSVTAEELEHIRAEHPDVFASLQVLPDPVVPRRTARRLAAAQAPKAASKAKAKAKGKPKRSK